MEGVDGIGRSVGDASALVEHHDTVADPRRLLGDGGLVAGEREHAVGDHPREAVEQLDVLALEETRPSSDGERRLPGHHRDQVALPAHGDALHPGSLAAGRDQLSFDHLPQAPRPPQEGTLGVVDQTAHQVLLVQCLARAGPHLPEDDEAAPLVLGRGDRDEQHEVPEAEIGEHAPGAHEPLEVPQRARLEPGVAPGDVRRCRDLTERDVGRGPRCRRRVGTPTATEARVLARRLGDEPASSPPAPLPPAPSPRLDTPTARTPPGSVERVATEGVTGIRRGWRLRKAQSES